MHIQQYYGMARTGEGGLQAVLELLHLFLESPQWEASAMERAKQLYLSHYRSLSKGLERATADRVISGMLGSDRCAGLSLRPSKRSEWLPTCTPSIRC